jgi:phage terminase large subunit GpA-like protein
LQEDDDQLRTYLTLAANYLALVEGEALDARSMMERRSTIAERYLEAAERDPWTPPCSFCGERPTVAWFEGPRFRDAVDAPAKVQSDEAWTACARCFELVQADDREELARRGARRFGDRAGPELALTMTRGIHDTFWRARSET